MAVRHRSSAYIDRCGNPLRAANPEAIGQAPIPRGRGSAQRGRRAGAALRGAHAAENRRHPRRDRAGRCRRGQARGAQPEGQLRQRRRHRHAARLRAESSTAPPAATSGRPAICCRCSNRKSPSSSKRCRPSCKAPSANSQLPITNVQGTSTSNLAGTRPAPWEWRLGVPWTLAVGSWELSLVDRIGASSWKRAISTSKLSPSPVTI